MTKKVFSLACLLTLTFETSAATWYIDNTATNGLNNGTSWANAWLDLNHIVGPPYPTASDIVYISGGPVGTTRVITNTTINYNPANLNVQIGQDASHGGTIIFDGSYVGDYWLKSAQNCSFSGNYQGSNHFIVTNYLNNCGVIGDRSTGVTLDHITFAGSIRFNGATNIALSYCSIVPGNNMDYAIYWNVYPDTYPGSYTNNLIHNCYISPARQLTGGFGSDCIQCGRCSSVFSNVFSPYFVASFTEGQHADGWQNNETGVNCAIYDNVFENIPNYPIYWELIAGGANNLLVYNNVFRTTGNVANTSSLYITIGQQGVNGYTNNNILVANNTFIDGLGRGAIGLGQNGRTNTFINCYCVNNLCYDSGNGAAIFLDNNASGVPANTYTNGFALMYNYLEAGISGCNVISPSQLVTPAGNPPIQFVNYSQVSGNNDFHLAANDQAATKQGTNLTALFASFGINAVDKDGVARPATGNWDIGAYQNVLVSAALDTGFNTGSDGSSSGSNSPASINSGDSSSGTGTASSSGDSTSDATGSNTAANSGDSSPGSDPSSSSNGSSSGTTATTNSLPVANSQPVTLPAPTGLRGALVN